MTRPKTPRKRAAPRPSSKPCEDCVAEGITTKRKTTGVRTVLCASHRRARGKAKKTYSHEQHILETYGITAEQYWEIYRQQGGVCYICRRARGLKKKLSVDHCHATGMVRGLLCTMCNRNVLGHLRDDPEAAQRVIDYLRAPPAVEAIGVIITPDMKGIA